MRHISTEVEPPSYTVRVYLRDIEVIPQVSITADPPGTARGDVAFFSSKSRKRLAHVAGNSPVVFTTMITLTYPRSLQPFLDGPETKRQLNAFLTRRRTRSWSITDERNVDFSYLWFMEFTRAGTPHFHVLCDRSLPDARPPGPGRAPQNMRITRDLCEEWTQTVSRSYSLTTHEFEGMLKASVACEQIVKVDGARRYVMKYAYKTDQKRVPEYFQRCGRFWGCSRDCVPQPFSEVRNVRGWELGELARGRDGRPFRYQFNGVRDLSSMLEDLRARQRRLPELPPNNAKSGNAQPPTRAAGDSTESVGQLEQMQIPLG